MLALALLSSCVMKQSIDLGTSGAADIRFNYVVSPTVAETVLGLQDMNSSTGTKAPANRPLFDLKGIRAGFEKNKGITVKALSTPTKTSLAGEILVSNFESLFTSGDARKAGLIRLDRASDTATIKIHIAKDTVGQLAALFPESERSFVDIFAPPAVEGTEMTEAEYLDMLKSIFGNSVVPDAKKSVCVLSFTPAGRILSQKGGTVQHQSVVFSIPILKVLVLEKPLDYSVTYSTKD